MGQERPTATRRLHRTRIMLEVLGAGTLVGLVAVAAGFGWFLFKLDLRERTLGDKADAIVVLTGGASRIEDALALLEAGHGRRLLITGVHRATRADELARLMPQTGPLFACCIDIDRRALNTTGNAVETSVWVRRHGFRSLIVVTSSYHMPRTMIELGGAMPGVELVPFPVVSEQLRNGWWTSPRTARLVAVEYVKYIVARVRLRLEPAPAPLPVATARSP